jgi:hypothetical protein
MRALCKIAIGRGHVSRPDETHNSRFAGSWEKMSQVLRLGNSRRVRRCLSVMAVLQDCDESDSQNGKDEPRDRSKRTPEAHN